jgi:tetratricopeptide (TPR) repeat protein
MYKIKSLTFLIILILYSCSSVRKTVEIIPVSGHVNDSVKKQFLYYYYEGLKEKENNQLDQAIETFRLCASLDSLDAGVQAELGVLYSSIGLNTDASRYFENAVRFQPANWWYSIQLITIYSQLKQLDKAINTANQVQKYFPRKPEIYNVLATLYKQAKQWDKAIAAFNKLENLTGIDQTISFEKFRLYLQLNNPQKGIAEIDKLINKFPTENRFKVLRGDIFMQQKQPEKAFEIYQNVLKDDPENPFVYVSLSEYYKAENQPEKAMESIVSALKNDHLDVDTKMNILSQYVEKMVQDTAKFDETESLFKLLVDRYPLEEQVHSYYAEFLQFRKRNVEAVSELETMLNINPKNEQTWLRLIQIGISEQNFDQVLTVTKRAIDVLPKTPAWYFYRGIAQYQKTEYPEALKTYKTGLPLVKPEQNTLKSDFYAQIADIYYKLEQKDSAFANYNFSLSANPQNIMVMNNYAYYLSLEKSELKKAEKMSAKTVELEPKNSTYLDTYAWILYQEGSYTLAKFYIERAIDNLSKDVEPGIIQEHYGDILWMSGKDDGKNDAKALEMWQKSYDSGNKTDELLLKIKNKGWRR